MRPQLGYLMGGCQIIQGDARQLGGLCDKIISSPPYSDISMGGGLNTKPPREGNKDQAGRSPDSPSQRGLVDKIVTSPPYAESVQSSRHSDSGPEQRRNRLIKAGYNPDDYQLGIGRNCQVVWEYGKDKDNIGNLKSATYLQAMLQVYQQCHSVLKPAGLMILVTKNFIRNKQIVKLDVDTIKLCEQAGFSYLERHYRELPSQSFWRVIYHQKNPEVEQIKYEDILVFKK